MSKNDPYFNKLKKIKKGVAFESVKKVVSTEKELLQELEIAESKIDKLKILNANKDRDIMSYKAQVSDLRNHIILLEHDMEKLETTLMEKYKYDVEASDEAKDSYSKLERKCSEIVRGLKYYSEGNHYKDGTFGSKVLDRGEHAKEILEKLNSESSNRIAKSPIIGDRKL